MGKIQDLINELCPDGVPYKSLGELGSFYGGLSGKSKKDFDDGNAKYITYMNIYLNPEVDIAIDDLVKIGEGEKQNTVQYGDILFTGSSENKEECAIASVLTQETNEPLYLNSFCFGFRLTDPTLFLPAFTKHLFRCGFLRKQLQQTASGVTRFNVSKGKMAKVIVPIPPIEVQEEIVRILDDYVSQNISLIDALKSELVGRKTQYECYCEKVFDFAENSGGTTTNIKSVCTKTCSGGTPKTSHSSYYGGDIPWLRTQEVDWDEIFDTEIKITEEGLSNSSAKLIPANCVIVAMYGATAAKSAINRIPLSTNQACCNLLINTDITSAEYVFYWLKKEYKKLKALGRGSQDNLNADMVKNYPIILPKKDVQTTIINRIDELTKMYESLVAGIQSEISLRQTQYEYYRDKLLTFAELKEG